MAEVQSIRVLVDSLTFGSSIYNAGQVVLDATEEMLICADDRRTNDAGDLLCERLTKQEALKAARRFDEEEADEPAVEVPVAAPKKGKGKKSAASDVDDE